MAYFLVHDAIGFIECQPLGPFLRVVQLSEMGGVRFSALDLLKLLVVSFILLS
jgi:hypothetical protein